MLWVNTLLALMITGWLIAWVFYRFCFKNYLAILINYKYRFLASSRSLLAYFFLQFELFAISYLEMMQQAIQRLEQLTLLVLKQNIFLQRSEMVNFTVTCLFF